MGRRVFLALVGLGALGVLTGDALQRAWRRTVGSAIRVGQGFRIYTVTGSVPRMSKAAWRLRVDGLVENPLDLSWEEFAALPRETQVHDFHCVTGWSVDDVRWTGVLLSSVLDEAGVRPGARYVRFHSFDGAYTENLTLEQARLPDVMLAFERDGRPLSPEQGYPVRCIVPRMYGYKGTKWVSRLEVTSAYHPGFWVQRGYDEEGWVGRSNDRGG